MNTTNQPRRPAGTPAGGQWAPTAHDEVDIDLSPSRPRRGSEWGERDRTRLLTEKERDQVQAWRAVARRYRHGDCRREAHKVAPGCDIVCVSAHSRFTTEEAGSDLLRRPPWEKSYRRPTRDEDNAATNLMCKLVMHAVPKPEAAQPGPKDQPCDGKAGHPARDCRACAVESERQMLFSMYGR